LLRNSSDIGIEVQKPPRENACSRALGIGKSQNIFKGKQSKT